MIEAPTNELGKDIAEASAMALDLIHDLSSKIRKLREANKTLREENELLHKDLALMEMRLEKAQR